jgi:hypothetical protein
VVDDAGRPVTAFARPLRIHIAASRAGDLPAYSRDGLTWTAIAPLLSPGLPLDGELEGYYLYNDSSLDIVTLHATYFALLEDVQAPSAPRLAVKQVRGGLRLSWPATQDNVRVAGYVVGRDGHGYRATRRTLLVVPARAGSYRVVAVDEIGNKSKASAVVHVRVGRGGIALR